MKKLFQKHRGWIAFFGVFLPVAFLVWIFGFKMPQQNRDWAPDQLIVSEISFWDDGEGFDLRNARNWSYAPEVVVSEDYFDESYAYDDLEGLKFYVVPLDKKNLTAHTFVVFEFKEKYGDKKNLAISIEARREKDVPYSTLEGIFNQYEVMNIWATAEDIITKRTIYWGDQMDEYEMILSQKDKVGVLKSFLIPSQKLQAEPQFYNTLTQNCTNALAQYINDLYPGKIPWDISFILTGKSGEYLEELGYVKFIKTLRPQNK